MKKMSIVLLAFLTFFTLSGCKKEEIKVIKSNYEFIDLTEIKIEVQESYHVQVMLKENNISDITFKSNNPSIFEVIDNEKIIGKKEGKAQLQILAKDGKQQGINIQVFPVYALKDTFSMDKGRLYQKNVLFYGDSITQYEVWEGEYVLHLKDYYQFNHKNLAKSGTTIAYSSRYQGKENGVTYMVQHETDNQWADYVFILYQSKNRKAIRRRAVYIL